MSDLGSKLNSFVNEVSEQISGIPNLVRRIIRKIIIICYFIKEPSFSNYSEIMLKKLEETKKSLINKVNFFVFIKIIVFF